MSDCLIFVLLLPLPCRAFVTAATLVGDILDGASREQLIWHFSDAHSRNDA